ncbi:hypothetical protein FOL47_010557 [Perkinsus chesapeaki]|uniref:BED-type domain-containing protein n=1 Tax=Perkinsus chesapeaki TaxID=330153 RepID=A0A7J6L1A4_PERCH|nr:hypothetical protein FOL47_010557 [Perkinsus chesapeaki]
MSSAPSPHTCRTHTDGLGNLPSERFLDQERRFKSGAGLNFPTPGSRFPALNHKQKVVAKAFQDVAEHFGLENLIEKCPAGPLPDVVIPVLEKAFGEAAKALRSRLCEALGCVDRPSIGGASFRGPLWQKLHELFEDDDASLALMIDRPFPVGILNRIPSAGNLPPFVLSGAKLSREPGDLRPAFKNYLSAESLPEVIRRTVDEEVEAGRMVYLEPGSKEFEESVPVSVAAVPKGSPGDYRLVEDYRRSGRTFLRAQHVCLPFGLRSAATLWSRISGFATRLTFKLCDVHQRYPLLGYVYVDDIWLLVPKACYAQVVARTLLLASCLGLWISWKKVAVWCSRSKALGYEISLYPNKVVPSYIGVPTDKALAIEDDLSELQRGSECSLSTLRRVSGRLTWCGQAWPLLKPYLRHVYATVHALEVNPRSFRVRVGRRLDADLRVWREALQAADYPIFPSPSLSAISSVSVTDASVTAIGGFVKVSSGAKTSVYFFRSSVDRLPGSLRRLIISGRSPTCRDIAGLELLAAALGVCLAVSLTPRSAPLRVLTDNQAVAAALRKCYSSKPALSVTLRALACYLGRSGRAHSALEVGWIKGEENVVADALTRFSANELDLPAEWTERPVGVLLAALNVTDRASPISTFAAMPVSHDPGAFECKQYASNTSNSASSSSKDDVNVGDTSPTSFNDPEETPQCRTIPEKRRKSLVSTGECTSRKIRKLSASCFDTSRREQNGAQMGQALDLLSYALAGPKLKSKSKVWENFSLVKRICDDEILDDIAACNRCLTGVSHIDSNTSSMIRHQCKLDNEKSAKMTQFPGVLKPTILPDEQRSLLVEACVKLSSAVPGIGFCTYRSDAMLEFVQTIIDITTKTGRPWCAAKSIPSDTSISRRCKEITEDRRKLIKMRIGQQLPPYQDPFMQIHFDAWLKPYQNRHLLGLLRVSASLGARLGTGINFFAREPRVKPSLGSYAERAVMAASRSSPASRESFVHHGLSKSSHRQHRSSLALYEKTSSAAGLVAFPVSAEAVIALVESMTAANYAIGTVRKYFGTVRLFACTQEARVFSASESRDFDLAIRSAAKVLGEGPHRRAATLNLNEIVEVRQKLAPLASLMFSLGVTGLLRVSELLSLNVDDVSSSPFGAVVRVTSSKSDIFRAGALVPIGCLSMNGTGPCHSRNCVAHALLAHASLLDPSDLLFEISRDSFAAQLREAVVEVAQCDPSRATTHLMRRSGAVHYFRNGMSLTTLGELGRTHPKSVGPRCLSEKARAGWRPFQWSPEIRARSTIQLVCGFGSAGGLGNPPLMTSLGQALLQWTRWATGGGQSLVMVVEPTTT